MKVTFGKWNGWDTDNLAKAGMAGRSYLEWGSENLESPKWRTEFKRALADNTTSDLHLVASAAAKADGITYEEAYEWAEEMKLEADAHAAKEEKLGKLQNYFVRQLTEIGVSQMGIVHLKSHYWEIDEMVEAGRAQFETAEKQAFILDLCNRYVEAVAGIEME